MGLAIIGGLALACIWVLVDYRQRMKGPRE